MSKSEKRKAHDARKAGLLADERWKASLREAEERHLRERCNCENYECEETGEHIAGSCGTPATDPDLWIEDIGRVCAECWKTHPEYVREQGSRIRRMKRRYGG